MHSLNSEAMWAIMIHFMQHTVTILCSHGSYDHLWPLLINKGHKIWWPVKIPNIFKVMIEKIIHGIVSRIAGAFRIWSHLSETGKLALTFLHRQGSCGKLKLDIIIICYKHIWVVKLFQCQKHMRCIETTHWTIQKSQLAYREEC